MLTGWAQSTFLALSHRDFRILWIGAVFAQLSFSMQPVAQGVVAFDLTSKNSAVGFVSLGMGISMVTLGPVGGVLADRLSKRKLLFFSQTVIGVMFGVIGTLILTDTVTIVLLMLSTLTMGTMFPIMGPPRQAWTGDMLKGPTLGNGVALNQMAMNGTRLVGPFLAGGLIALPWVDVGGTYLFMALNYALVVVLLFFSPPTTRSEPTGRSVSGDLTAGIRYIWQTPDLRLLTAAFAGIAMAGLSYQVLMPGLL